MAKRKKRQPKEFLPQAHRANHYVVIVSIDNQTKKPVIEADRFEINDEYLVFVKDEEVVFVVKQWLMVEKVSQLLAEGIQTEQMLNSRFGPLEKSKKNLTELLSGCSS